MYIKNVKLKDFRNYEDLNIKFNKKLNIIIGNNAQGKTNIIESIYVSSIGKSFRTNSNSELIRFGCNICKIETEYYKDDYNGSVEITINSDSKKSAKIDGVKINKASELLNNIYTVIFSPEDLKIVKEEPEKRRKFINRELSQLKLSYYDSLINYRRVLQQRNNYLKEDNIDKNMMDIWDTELVKYGSLIIHHRKNYIDELNTISSEIHTRITNSKEKLNITYESDIKYCENLNEQQQLFYEVIKKSYNNDFARRTTLRGPHKDDLEFTIDNINVRNFGSQGQQRTTALSLKLAELSIIKKETGEDAILLLDDVMSELDYERQEFLVKSLSDNQLFITTTDIPEKIINKFYEGNIYKVNSGTVSTEEYIKEEEK